MNFLKAKKVEKIVLFGGCEIIDMLTTNDWETQCFSVFIPNEGGPEKTQILIHFDKNHPAPKKINISANQYTMEPIPLVIYCYLKGKETPYLIKEMGELNTILSFEDNTEKIVIDCAGRYAGCSEISIRLSVNFMV